MEGECMSWKRYFASNQLYEQKLFPCRGICNSCYFIMSVFFLCHDTEMVNSKLLKSDLKSLMKEPDVLPDFSFPLRTKALNAEG